jgi:hypothetical protein
VVLAVAVRVAHLRVVEQRLAQQTQDQVAAVQLMVRVQLAVLALLFLVIPGCNNIVVEQLHQLAAILFTRLIHQVHCHHFDIYSI